jgi:RNA polymerase sigma-70 factor (ECF subfamily)
MLSHLDAAYNVARWLTRRDEDARDVVQEAYLRAWQFFGGFRGGDARAWLLTIVRNTAHTWLRRDGRRRSLVDDDSPFDEQLHGTELAEAPDAAALRDADANTLRGAIERLPVELREVIVLREMEGLSYKQIADAVRVPIGTVMSRLSRARRCLLDVLSPHAATEGLP